MKNECTFEGCGRIEKLTKGFCRKHYMRLYRTGDAATVRTPGNPGLGRSDHFMYGAYSGMINRCYNPNNSSYARYGAKGVYVCQRWRDDFLNFLADMGERPQGMTLDRINPEGPYSPENCRWANSHVQRANQTEQGEASNRAAMSNGVKGYWQRWRENPEVRAARKLRPQQMAARRS